MLLDQRRRGCARADFHAGRGGDGGTGIPFVDDRVVPALGDLIERSGVVEDVPGNFQGQAMTLEIRIEETVRGVKGETTWSEPKPKLTLTDLLDG